MSNQASVPLRVMNFWRDGEAFNIPTAPSARHAAVELGIPGIQRLPHDLWAQPETREQPINLVSAHEGTVLYLYTPHFPEDATLAAARLSAGDISLLEGMTAHRYPPAADGHQVDDQQGTAAGALVSARRFPFLTLPD